jgi:hypothetical protein
MNTVNKILSEFDLKSNRFLQPQFPLSIKVLVQSVEIDHAWQKSYARYLQGIKN